MPSYKATVSQDGPGKPSKNVLIEIEVQLHFDISIEPSSRWDNTGTPIPFHEFHFLSFIEDKEVNYSSSIMSFELAYQQHISFLGTSHYLDVEFLIGDTVVNLIRHKIYESDEFNSYNKTYGELFINYIKNVL